MFPSPARVGEALKLPHEHLLFVEYLMMVVLASVQYYHIVVLICISLILSDLEIPFMCLLALLYFFCGDMPFRIQKKTFLGESMTRLDSLL